MPTFFSIWSKGIKMAMLKARTEFALALNQICHERGLNPEDLVAVIEEAVLAAFKKDFGVDEELEYRVSVDQDTGQATIFSFKEGKEDKAKEVTPPGFGRIAAQVAKQVILQKIREAEKNIVLAEYEKRIGQPMSGMVLRFEGPAAIVDIGKTEGVMPTEEQIRGERLSLGQRLTVLLVDIRETMRGRRAVVSRTADDLVKSLFRREVPEVSSGAVEIKGIAREPGQRTKIAVASTQPGVDPVGSCVGQKGVRVQAVINELGGEKIDIVPFNNDPVKFIIAALSPAENVEVTLKGDREAEVIVPEDQLSLAIGKEGQNVRLAAKLTGYKIEINDKSGSKRSSSHQGVGNSLIEAGLSTRTINALSIGGIESVVQLKKMDLKEIKKIKGIGPKSVKEIEKVLG